MGTVKDTIHTTELDTAYLRGRQLLEKRKYAQALYVLHDYRDRNTAIALLSLGQDREALRILDGIDDIAICRLTGADVVRHALVQKIIAAYEKDDQQREKHAAAAAKKPAARKTTVRKKA